MRSRAPKRSLASRLSLPPLPLLFPLPLLLASCNTSGLKSVYLSADEQGNAARDHFVAGTPIFCVADVAIGDPKASLRVSMQPLVVNGERAGLPPLLVAEHSPGKFSGKIATEFPKLSVQAVPDARDPNVLTPSQNAQAPGRYRCVVELDDELDYVEFDVLPGSQPSFDPNAPPPGECKAETVASCPLVNPGPNIVRCCTPQGACGTGPLGTAFCYESR